MSREIEVPISSRKLPPGYQSDGYQLTLGSGNSTGSRYERGKNFGTAVAGASGDIVMSVLAMRYSAHAFFVDERDGMRVFLPVKQQAYA